MNIFAIEGEKNKIDWEKSAKSLDNLRVVKMILETAQLLCTGLSVNGIQAPYKPFNPKHPSCLWVSESSSNWLNLFNYSHSLLSEYSNRFNKTHKCAEIIKECENLFSKCTFASAEETPLRMAMPQEFKDLNNIVGSYRKYYSSKPNIIYPEDKIPSWFIDSRDKNLKFKIKTKQGKIEEINLI